MRLILFFLMTSFSLNARSVQTCEKFYSSDLLFVNNIVNSIRQNLLRKYSTSGFKNREELIKYFKKYYPKWSSNIDFLLAGEFSIGIHAPNSIRENIIREGILNTHQTHTSQLVLDVDHRSNVESKLSGINREAYDNLLQELKPKYGTLFPSKNWPIKPHYLDYIGDDVWILKDNLKKNSTFTNADSFRAFRTLPKNNLWDSQFIPMDFVEFIIPFLGDRKTLYPDVYDPNLHFYNVKEVHKKFQTKTQGTHYFEAQVWGQINLSDIAELRFKTPLPDHVKKILLENGILLFQRDGSELIPIVD